MQVLNQTEGKKWIIYQGDSCEIIKGIPDKSIHYTITSIPFASLYTYSNSERDLGNSRNYNEFWEHFSFMLKDWYRITMDGRLCSIHCMNLPTSKERHGYIGLQDFRGDVIRAMEKAGWVYHSEVCIWKDPVTAMQRTKALGLLHKQIRKDSCMCRQGIPDYVCTFRKHGENPERVNHYRDYAELKSYDIQITEKEENKIFPVDKWQQYASPVWMDINPSNTLQRLSAREERDERHICPLQLEVINRCIELWTNEGDIVFDPFDGIGSTGVCAVKMKRRHVGIELKKSYYEQAVANCKKAENERTQLSLLDFI